MRQAALKKIHELATRNPNVVFVGSDLGEGTLKGMQAEFPDRFFMEGISEQYMVGFAAGLAKEGFIPYLNTISTFFTRRAYEQIAIDVALHNLPVRILGSGGGMVYAPLGPTHTAVDDFSLMLNIPGLKVFAPADSLEMVNILEESLLDPAPHYIRIAKGGEPDIIHETVYSSFWTLIGKPNANILILTTGIILHQAIEARATLEEIAMSTKILHVVELSRISEIPLEEIVSASTIVFVAEEHVRKGGLYSEILVNFEDKKIRPKSMHHFYLDDRNLRNYGNQLDHLVANNLDSLNLIKEIRQICHSERQK